MTRTFSFYCKPLLAITTSLTSLTTSRQTHWLSIFSRVLSQVFRDRSSSGLPTTLLYIMLFIPLAMFLTMSSIQVFWSLSGKHAIQSSNHAISSNSFASGYLSPQALLITSVGGCCYSREIPVAKQKENRRRKIHAVRTHPKNDMKTATANKGGLRTQKQNDSKQIWIILIIGLFLFRLLSASF